MGDAYTGRPVRPRSLVIACLGFAVTRLYMVSVPPWLPDTIPYYDHAIRFSRGLTPYPDAAPFQYPPLAALLVYLPMLADPTDFPGYRTAFARQLLLFDVAAFALVLWVIWRDRQGISPVWAYIAFGALLQPLIYDRLDLVVGVLLLLSLVTYRGTLPARAWGQLAIATGFFVKLIPALAWPVLVAFPTDHTSRARGIREALTFGFLPWSVMLLASVLLFGGGLLSLLRYYKDQDIQIESVWSTIILSGLFLGHTPSIENRYASYRLVGTTPDAILPWTSLATLAFLLFAYLWVVFAWRRRYARGTLRSSDLFVGMTAVLLAAIASLKALSPQYFLWLAPLVPLCFTAPDQRRARWVLLALFALCIGTTSLLFRFLYWNLLALQPGPVLLLIARNGILLLMLGWILVQLWRAPPVPGIEIHRS